MKEISRHRWYRTMGVIAFAALFTAACAGPEKKEAGPLLAVARTAVADAVSAGAPEFAPVELRNAQENLDAAEKAALREDYKKAKWLSEKAQMNAQLAIAKTRAGKAKQAEEALDESHRVLQDEMKRTGE